MEVTKLRSSGSMIRVHRFLSLFQSTDALGERIDVVVIIFATAQQGEHGDSRQRAFQDVSHTFLV